MSKTFTGMFHRLWTLGSLCLPRSLDHFIQDQSSLSILPPLLTMYRRLKHSGPKGVGNLHAHQGLHTSVYSCSIFLTAHTWKPPRCPAVDQWINELWPIQTLVLKSAKTKCSVKSRKDMQEPYMCVVLVHSLNCAGGLFPTPWAVAR